MTGFFSKLFGGKKKTTSSGSEVVAVVEETLEGLFDVAGFDLQFDVSSNGDVDAEDVMVELSGADEALLTDKDGQLMNEIQFFMKRVIQHHIPGSRANVNIDCNGFREEANKQLIQLADTLKTRAIEQGRSVYLRALAPKDRKVIHQYLATDERVRSRSVGDGLYKKIKIYPVKNQKSENVDEELDNEVNGNV